MAGDERRRVAAVLLAGVLLVGAAGPAQAQMSCDPCAVGVVFDGPWERNEELRVGFEEEIEALAAPRFRVVFPAAARRVADWTLEGSQAAVEALLGDPAVDILLTYGPVASSHAINRGGLEKPVVGAFVLDPEAQGFPIETTPASERVSGVPNLSYITFTGDRTDEIRRLQEVAPFRRLTYLANEALLAAVPVLETNLRRGMQQVGGEAEIVRVGTSIDAALEALSPATEAVYLTPLTQLPPGEFDRLVRALIERRLPVFSYWGRSEVDRGVLASLYLDTDMRRLGRRAALHVQRILAGEDAGGLPVDFRRNRRLTLNMATARSIGVHPDWRVMTEAELLHDEPPNVARRLSLASAAREAVAANLDLAAADRSVAAGRQAVRAARATLRPQVTASGGAETIDRDRAESTFGLQPVWTSAGSVGVSQLLYSDGARARATIERHVQTSREQAGEELRLDVAHGAAVGYLGVLRARTFEQIQRENLTLTRSNLELAQSRRRIGVARASEVVRWENQIANNRRAVIEAGAARSIAEIALNRLLHRPLEEPFATADVDLNDPALLANAATVDAYVGNPFAFAIFRDFMTVDALAQSPELRQLDAAIAAQERTVLAARRRAVGTDGGGRRRPDRSADCRRARRDRRGRRAVSDHAPERAQLVGRRVGDAAALHRRRPPGGADPRRGAARRAAPGSSRRRGACRAARPVGAAPGGRLLRRHRSGRGCRRRRPAEPGAGHGRLRAGRPVDSRSDRCAERGAGSGAERGDRRLRLPDRPDGCASRQRPLRPLHGAGGARRVRRPPARVLSGRRLRAA